MGGPRTTQQQASTSNTTNTYGQISPLDDSRYAEAVGKVAGFKYQRDPRIAYTYGHARQNINDSYDNPQGGYTTPQLRDASRNAAFGDMAQNEAQEYRNENYGRQAIDYAQLADVAQMSAPRTVQTSGSTEGKGTSTSQTNPGVFDMITQGASLGIAAF